MHEKRHTSARHTEILNGYQSGDTSFNRWVAERLARIEIKTWAYGEMTLEWVIDDRFVMSDGVVFGGYIASVGDHLAGLVSMSVLTSDDERFRTARLETNFFRPLKAGRVLVDARIINASRTLINAELDVFNESKKHAARIIATQIRQRAAS